MHITLQDIHKHYGDLHANDGIHMEIGEGSIHAILGENGAGKSTLMKVLAGYIRKTKGTILLNNEPIEFEGPAHASRLGIGMLYQDPLDFPQLSVLENFIMGRVQGFSRNETTYRKQLEASARDLGFHLNPDRLVRYLTVGERQQLELLRLLALGIEVLILDEPTTGISNLQKGILFKALRKLADQKKSVLLVSHKLEDVEALCDRVAVLRQGKIVGEMDQPLNREMLLEWMFGSTPSSLECVEMEPGAIIFSMKGISAIGGRAGLRDCTVAVRQGEVIGLAGLEGSGQGLFLRLAAGLGSPTKGEIKIKEKVMTGLNHHRYKGHGVTFLPTARLEEGLIPGLTITEHIALQPGKGLLIPWSESRKVAKEKIDQFRIVGKPSVPVESLSGGNQQRLLLALVPANPELLLLENPTRGLDMESVQWVWTQLMDYAAKGATIVFSSSELEEILDVANRVLVFFNGDVVKDVRTCDITLNELGQAIAGVV